MQDKKQQLKLDTEQHSKLGKEYSSTQGCLLSPTLCNLCAEYIMQNAGLDEAQAGIKIAGRNINNIRYADDTTLMTESKEALKNLLMKVKEENEKADLILNIQKVRSWHLVLTSWRIDGEKVEIMTDFIFLGSKITGDGDCSHKIKMLAPWKKNYDEPRQHIKIRAITLLIKDHIVKAMIFPVIMYGCEELDHKEG